MWNPISVYTDNNLLQNVLMTAKLDATGHHRAVHLVNYNFVLNDKSGKTGRNADALSRISKEDHTWYIKAGSIQAIISNTTSSAPIVGAYSCNIQVTDHRHSLWFKIHVFQRLDCCVGSNYAIKEIKFLLHKNKLK